MIQGLKKLEFVSDGFREILESEGVHQAVAEETERIHAAANANNRRGGEGFHASTFLGGIAGRWIGTVYTTDHASRVAEAEDKALSSVVHG
ncbi:MAG: hypothetical protein UHU21_16065 [Lachnospiraceae bacterium]|nr:hypothetical protein [Lachnospiraceae bacterium]